MSEARSPVSTDIDFESEGKQVGHLRVPYARNSSAWGSLLIPILVIKHGQKPTVLLTGGVHGGEYEGPVSLMKLGSELQPDEIQGRVIVIPALNLPAVQAGQRLSPIDGKDLNRVFPGDPRGTVSEIIAHYVTESLLPACDAVIDIHSGGYSLRMFPYISMHYLEDGEQRQQTFAALQAFQAPVGLIMEEIGGEGLLDYEVERRGKVFLCAELGGGGALAPETLRIAHTGIRNLLIHLGIAPGEIVARESQGLGPTRLMEVPDEACYCVAGEDGIYESFFELGEAVGAGEAVGQIHCVQHPDREPREIVARRSGTLLSTRGPGYAQVGDCVALVAQELDPRTVGQ